MLCYKKNLKPIKTLDQSCKEIFTSFLHLFISATFVDKLATTY